MAATPYQFGNSGPTPTVEADTILPRQNIQTSPETFGAGRGRALEQVGGAIGAVGGDVLKASDFYGQVAMDDGANKLQQRLDTIKYGDPNATGPDGQPDTGFLGKRGDAAMSTYKPTMDQVDQSIKEIRDNLPSPKSQIEFDRFSGRMRADALARLGSHYEQESKSWASGVNKAAVQTNLTDIAREPDNDDLFNHRLADMQAASDKNVHLAGGGDQERQAGLDTMASAAWKTRIESIGVKDPARAAQLADQHKAELGLNYDTVAERLQHRSDEQVAIGAADKHIALAKTDQQTQFAQAAEANVSSLIKGREGLILTPKWDVDHYRVGYGSDTITRPDGSVEEVKPGMTITKDDAERDLQRRVGLSQADVQKNIGPDAWSKLPPGAQSALTSISYNYGSLAKTPGVIAAARNGDPAAISDAILGLKGQNNGVNDRRREIEASIASGGVIPAPQGTGAARSIGGGATPSALLPGPSVAPSHQYPPGLQPAAMFTGAPQPPPLQPPVAVQPTPEQTLAATYRSIDADQDLTDVQKDMAKRKAHEKVAQDAVADEATKKAREELQSTAANEVLDLIHSGRGPDAIMRLGPSGDTRFVDYRVRDHLWNIAMADASGSKIKDKIRYGDGFEPTLKRMTLPPDDPNFLRDPTELVGMLDRGEITEGGYERLYQISQRTKKGEYGPLFTQVLSDKISYVRDKMQLDQEYNDIPGMPKVINRKGLEVYRNKVFPAFNDGLADAEKDGPKAVRDFLAPENLDKIVAPYLKEAKQGALEAKVGALGVAREQATQAQLAHELQFLAPPNDVPADKWNEIIAQPPTDSKGVVFTAPRYAGAVKELDQKRNDPKYLNFWRQKFPDVDPLALLQKIDDERKAAPPKGAQPEGPPAPSLGYRIGSAIKGGVGALGEGLVHRVEPRTPGQ